MSACLCTIYPVNVVPIIRHRLHLWLTSPNRYILFRKILTKVIIYFISWWSWTTFCPIVCTEQIPSQWGIISYKWKPFSSWLSPYGIRSEALSGRDGISYVVYPCVYFVHNQICIIYAHFIVQIKLCFVQFECLYKLCAMSESEFIVLLKNWRCAHTMSCLRCGMSRIWNMGLKDSSHESHNASNKYPTMHHSPVCLSVHAHVHIIPCRLIRT